ncbi:MAG: uracil-DNA glycosylase [Anaerolinea sp.]|nr:uracil-DNA glycosylase [Anaerolinea sp.]
MTTSLAIAESLYERVRSCQGCGLARTRTNSVPGEGPLNAEVLLIGEAPGANEDRQGRPFVGQAGQFLDELLAAGGLKRSEVYICNVLKCRPPANRDPGPDEIAACAGYLDEQIQLVDPLVIVTLGRFSMGKFFPQQSISRIHGTFKQANGRFVVPMYHPAAALHQQSLRTVILNDFRALPAILDRARRLRAREQEQGGATVAAPAQAEAASRQPDAGAAATPQAAPIQQIRLFD